MKYRARYLIKYPDVNRWGETHCPNVKAAQTWLNGCKSNNSFIELQIFLGPKLLQHWKRDERNRLQRIWQSI
jgi:hypothetical protein